MKAYLSASPHPNAARLYSAVKITEMGATQKSKSKKTKALQSIYPVNALSYKLDYTFAKGAYGTFWHATIYDKASPRN
jgi:uncharacterized membrane-anchored protein